MIFVDVVYWIMAAIFTSFAAIVLFKFSKMDLSALVSEGDAENRKASLSRFQFLLFTFVIAGVYLTLCLESGTFVEIPNGVLGLIGISGGSYVVSKGISGGKPNATKPDDSTG